jgi:serine/threonine protein kinase/tetratricopeptide (TPR) repeat protein
MTMTLCRSAVSSGNDHDSVLDDVLEELANRVQAGDPVDCDAILAKYPEHAEALRRLLPAMEVMAEFGVSASRLAARGEPPSTTTARSLPDAELGTLGDFRILREIGRGGMGVVYEAEQISLGRRVALKVLPFAAALDAQQLQRFKTEAHAAAQLHHTNIVPVFWVGCERGVHYYAMQFIEGQTLAQAIAEQREMEHTPRANFPPLEKGERRGVGRRSHEAVEHPIPDPRSAAPAAAVEASPPTKPASSFPFSQTAEFVSTASAQSGDKSPHSKGSSRTREFIRTAVGLGIQAAEALDHAHKVGIIHRDIKPANMLLDTQGRLWITDFGLARLQDDAGVTMTGDLLGTLRYMSPEQALAKRGYLDHRTDIYSLGATLYELLTLRPAVEGKDQQEVLRKIAQEEPAPPRKVNPAVPRDLETILLKAMAKSPEERYATAQELADDLRRFLDDRPLVAKRPNVWQRAAKWARRHKPLVRAISAGLAIAVIALAASSVFAWRAYRAEADQRRLADERYREAKEQRRQAREAVDEMYLEVAHDWLDRQPQMTDLQKRFLQKVLHYYQEFAQEKGDDEEARFAKAEAYLRVGQIRVFSLISEHDRAEAPLLKANALLEELANQFPNKGIYTFKLAEAQNMLSFSRVEGDKDKLERSVSLMERLVERFPTESEYRYGLAVRLSNLGEDVTLKSRNLAGGERLCRRAVALLEELIRSPSARPDYYRILGCAADGLAESLRQGGNSKEAAENYRKAIAAMQRLTPDSSGLPEYEHDLKPFWWHNLGNSCRGLGCTLGQLKRLDEAEAAFAQAIRIHAKLVADFPTAAAYYTALFRDYRDKGTMFWARGKSHEASQAFSEARDFAERTAAAFPPEELTHDFPLFLVTCSDPKWRNAKRAREWAGKAAERHPAYVEAWNTLGITHYRLGDYPSAIAALKKAASLRSDEHAADEFFLAMAYRQVGDERQAHEWYGKAVAWMEKNRLQDQELLRYRAEVAALMGATDLSTSAARKKEDSKQTAKP